MSKNMPVEKKTPLRLIGKIIARILASLLSLFLLVVIALLAVMWVLAKGPSPTAQRLFVMSVKETSAIGFLANIFLSNAEIDRIMMASEPEKEFYDTDTSLISIPKAKPAQPGGSVGGGENIGAGDSTESLPDETVEEKELELIEITGNGYSGYMLIVRDPKRIFVGTPTSYGGMGVTLMGMIERTGAVAGINAGGFYDPNGTSYGGEPDGIVICDGVLKWGAGKGYVNVIGFDGEGILHVGTMTPTAAMNLGLQYAVSFGPSLISNGVSLSNVIGPSGINPRTAIGQRADGAVLMLVIDGRQIHSLGATFEDLIEIFLDYGAVNAANLDGGSSTLMMLDGEIINSCASIVGPRLIPTAFLVK